MRGAQDASSTSRSLMSGCNPSHQQQQQLRLPFLHHRNGTIMGRTRKRASQPPSPTNSCVESCSNEMMLLQPSDGKKHKPTIGADKENDAETSSSTSQVCDAVVFARSVSTSALEVAPHRRNGAIVVCDEHHHPTIPELFSVNYSLAGVPRPRHGSSAYRSIDARTLVDLFDAYPTAEAFNRRYTLVDCRYDYEYKGGHIRHAINITSDEQMLEAFFARHDNRCPTATEPTTILIFYCEYSQQRGPYMAHKVREMDRRRNVHRYPLVYYSEMYLLDGGYSQFFEREHFINYCDPPSYVQMKDKRHADALRQLKKKSKSFNCIVPHRTAAAARMTSSIRKYCYSTAPSPSSSSSSDMFS